MMTSWACDSRSPEEVILTKRASRRSVSDVSGAHVAHPGTQPPDELVDQGRERALVRDPPLDPLGHELPLVQLVLEVAVGGAALHRGDRAHPAVLLEGPALVEDRLAGRLLGPGEEASDHHRGRARGERLRDVARELDPAVRDDGNVRLAARDVRLGDGRHLRDPGAGHDAGRADAPRADPDLDGVDAALHERPGSVPRRDVARDELELGELPAERLDHPKDVLAVSVCGVDDEHVRSGLGQGRRALARCPWRSRRRPRREVGPARPCSRSGTGSASGCP